MGVNRPKVFYACDTNNGAYADLRAGLTAMADNLGLELSVFDQEIEHEGAILEKVEREISAALCVIADVGCDSSRPPSANVLLEVGIAKGLSRPTILLLREPSSAPANLHGRDFVRYPSCLQVGTSDHHALTSFLRDLEKGILEGRASRIFSSRSHEYLEVLQKITRLPGREWFVAPEFRSFMRPQDAEGRWLRDFRRVSPARLESEISLRVARREAFEANLMSHGCIDIYPRSALELRTWRGMSLKPDERKGFISEALRLLRSFPNYEFLLIDSDNRQKYWIKETQVGAFVVFEGWGHIDITKDRATGGLVIADAEIVASFRDETDKLVERATMDRGQVIRLLEELLASGKGGDPV